MQEHKPKKADKGTPPWVKPKLQTPEGLQELVSGARLQEKVCLLDTLCEQSTLRLKTATLNQKPIEMCELSIYDSAFAQSFTGVRGEVFRKLLVKMIFRGVCVSNAGGHNSPQLELRLKVFVLPLLT